MLRLQLLNYGHVFLEYSNFVRFYSCQPQWKYLFRDFAITNFENSMSLSLKMKYFFG